MQIVYDMDKLLDVADDGLSIYDKDREEYRMTVWEEDGVLHVLFCEPVVIATQEDDVLGGTFRIPRTAHCSKGA